VKLTAYLHLVPCYFSLAYTGKSFYYRRIFSTLNNETAYLCDNFIPICQNIRLHIPQDPNLDTLFCMSSRALCSLLSRDGECVTFYVQYLADQISMDKIRPCFWRIRIYVHCIRNTLSRSCFIPVPYISRSGMRQLSCASPECYLSKAYGMSSNDSSPPNKIWHAVHILFIMALSQWPL
jgi:hypothetical protein